MIGCRHFTISNLTAFALVTGSTIPLMVNALKIPFPIKLSTWSFIRDCKGEIMTVRDRFNSCAINAGTW